MEQNHVRWARTVRSSPDVIEMTFYPITALLDGVAGKEHLTRAILLYLECKNNLCSLRGAAFVNLCWSTGIPKNLIWTISFLQTNLH